MKGAIPLLPESTRDGLRKQFEHIQTEASDVETYDEGRVTKLADLPPSGLFKR